MAAFATVLLLVLACLGGGALVLRAFRVFNHLPEGERLPLCFAVGFGLLGYTLFFPALAGWAAPLPLGLCVAVLASGALLIRGRPKIPPGAGVALALVVAALSLVQGLVAPTDGDSLAYHFALPKDFLQFGRLVFVPRAVDGAVPLLPQMTYMAALALGGERALTLWTAVSGLGAGWLLYAVGRRWLSPDWALAVALVFQTVPAVVYGAVSGQVEIRMAMLLLAAAIATAEARARNSLAWAAIAGLAVGFVVGAKYSGLVWAAAAGLAILMQRRSLVAGTVFALAAVLAGGQWYLWNFWNTGDPLFPMLFSRLPYAPGVPWSEIQAAYMDAAFTAAELSLPKSLGGLLAYPLWASIAADPVLETPKVGFGAWPLVLLPFAVVGAWRHRRYLAASPLGTMAAIAAASYVVWFLIGPSQRVRHFLPLLPLVLLPLAVAAERAAAREPELRRPILVATVVVLTVQLAGQAVFASASALSLARGEGRQAYLERMVRGAALVPAAEAEMRAGDRLFTPFRWLVYLFRKPVFYAHHADQAMVEIRHDAQDAAAFWRQLREQGISLLLIESTEDPNVVVSTGYVRMAVDLRERGCLRVVWTRPVLLRASRTFGGEADSQRIELLRVTPDSCAIADKKG